MPIPFSGISPKSASISRKSETMSAFRLGQNYPFFGVPIFDDMYDAEEFTTQRVPHVVLHVYSVSQHNTLLTHHFDLPSQLRTISPGKISKKQLTSNKI